MSTETDARLEVLHEECLAAIKAMRQIKKTAEKLVDYWLVVGKAIYGLKVLACENCGVNDILSNSPVVRKEFGILLRQEKLHDEDKDAPDKTTRGQLIKIMHRLEEVLKWYKELPKENREKWNHPDSIWNHFISAHQPPKNPKDPKGSKTTGLTKEEEEQQVENAQVEALRKRDAKISDLRDSIKDLLAANTALNVEVVNLRKVIACLLQEMGREVPEIPTDSDIEAAIAKGSA